MGEGGWRDGGLAEQSPLTMRTAVDRLAMEGLFSTQHESSSEAAEKHGSAAQALCAIAPPIPAIASSVSMVAQRAIVEGWEDRLGSE